MEINKEQIRWWEYAPSYKNKIVARLIDVPTIYMVGMHEKNFFILKDRESDPEMIHDVFSTRVLKIMLGLGEYYDRGDRF